MTAVADPALALERLDLEADDATFDRIITAQDVGSYKPEEPEDATKAKAAAKKQRRPSRFSEEEEDDMDDIEYSGRIH